MVGAEKCDMAFHQPSQRLGHCEQYGLRRACDPFDCLQIDRCTASPQKGLLVGVDGHTIEFDCPHQRSRRQRQQTPLVREAQHK